MFWSDSPPQGSQRAYCEKDLMCPNLQQFFDCANITMTSGRQEERLFLSVSDTQTWLEKLSWAHDACTCAWNSRSWCVIRLHETAWKHIDSRCYVCPIAHRQSCWPLRVWMRFCGRERTYVLRVLCSQGPMFPGSYVFYVPRFVCDQGT